jgi:DNA invertase Pin-like site-specific DNA recombinase
MARRAEKIKAIAYLRTSSAANVGADKDSDKRQREAMHRFAKSAGYEIAAEFFDAAVSGADALETRPGFSALLDMIETNGVRTVIVEDASRFARELLVQEAGILALRARGVTVVTAGGDNLTETSDPYKIAMRQMAGVFAQLEKARLVAKLRHARERKRAEGQKVEGRKSHVESNPEAVALAKRLRRASPKTGERMSYRDIAAKLAEEGHKNRSGKPFGPSAIKSMLRQKPRRGDGSEAAANDQ